MARKRFNHSKLKVVGKKRKLYTGDWLWNNNLYDEPYPSLYSEIPSSVGYVRQKWTNSLVNPDGSLRPLNLSAKSPAQFYFDKMATPEERFKYFTPEAQENYYNMKTSLEQKDKNSFWNQVGKGIESIASKTSSLDPQDPSNAFFGGKYVAGAELFNNIAGRKYNRGVKGAQFVNSLADAIPIKNMGWQYAAGKAGVKDSASIAQQLFGYRFNDENIAKVEGATAAANANTATYNNYDSIMDANFNHAFNFNKKYIGDQGPLSNGRDDKYDELVLLNKRAGKREGINLATSIDQTGLNALKGLERQWYGAYGGNLRKRPHKFADGGSVTNSGNPADIGGGWFSDMGNLFSKGWFQHAGKGVSSMYKSGQLNGVISAAGDFAYKGLTGGMNTNVGVGNAMNKFGDVAAMVPGPYGAITSAALKTVGGLTNRMFGSKLNYENIEKVKGDIAAANANTATLNDYDSIMNNNWNNANYVSKSYIGKDGWFSNKAKKTWRNLMTQVGRASDRENLAQAISTEQTGMNTLKGLERQWAAYGGKLNRYDNGGRVNKFDGTEESQIEREPHSLNENGEYLYTLPDGRTAVADRKGNLISFDNEGHTKVAGSNLNYIQELPEVVLEQNPETVISDNFDKSDIAKLYRRDRPLAMISPEFDLLTLARSLGWNGLKALRNPSVKLDDPHLVYRQGKGIIADAKKTGIVRAHNSTTGQSVPFFNYGETYYFDPKLNPYTNNLKARLSYLLKGKSDDSYPNYLKWYEDLIVGRPSYLDRDLEYKIIDPWGRFSGQPGFDPIEGFDQVTPVYKGLTNNAPLKFFNTYRYNHLLGKYVNTELRAPLTGLDFLFDSADHAEGGNLRAGLDTALNNRIAMNKRAYNTRSAYNANGVPVINVPNLNVPYAAGGDIDDFTEYGLGGRITIKKENRGKFTKSAKRAGMSVQQYAKHVLANPDKYSPQERKRANFARNAKKWKKALGGDLFNALAYGGWTAPNPYVRHLVTGGSEGKKWYDYEYDKAAEHFQVLMGSGWTKQTAGYFDEIKSTLDASGLPEGTKKAILQNMYRESSFDPYIQRKGSKYKGLLQWDTTNRWKKNYDQGARAQTQSIIDQMKHNDPGNDYMTSYLYEGVTPESLFYNKDISPETALYWFNRSYVRNGRDPDAVDRQALSMANYGRYTNQGELQGVSPSRVAAIESRENFANNMDELLTLLADMQAKNDEANREMSEAYASKIAELSDQLQQQQQINETAQRAVEDQKRKDVVAGLLGIPTKESIFASIMTGNKKKDKDKEERSSGMVNPYVLQRAFGGELGTQGGDFTNGLTQINAGGAHETNPYEGVPMGTDLGGTPNVVEEGETIYEDYVFSNRLYVPAEFIKKHKLGSKGTRMTFAEASKKLARESEERPNDPISLAGLDMDMQELRETQEDVKMKKQQEEMMRQQEQAQSLEEMMALMGGMPAGPMGGPGEEGMSPEEMEMARQQGLSPEEALAQMQGNPEGGMSPEEAAMLMAQQGRGGGMPSDMVGPEGMPEGEPGIEQQLAEEQARQQAETSDYYANGGRLGRRVNKFDGPDSPSSLWSNDTTDYANATFDLLPLIEALQSGKYVESVDEGKAPNDEKYAIGTLPGLMKLMENLGLSDYYAGVTDLKQIENSSIYKAFTDYLTDYVTKVIDAERALYADKENAERKKALEDLLYKDQRYSLLKSIDKLYGDNAPKMIFSSRDPEKNYPYNYGDNSEDQAIDEWLAENYNGAFSVLANEFLNSRRTDGNTGIFHVVSALAKAQEEKQKQDPESPEPLETKTDEIEPFKYGYSKIGDALTAGQVIADIAGLNGPDYTEANTLMRLANDFQAPHVSAPMIQTREQYKPYDIMQLVNDERAKSAGTSRMIANTSGNNKGLVEAALLANRSSQNPNSESYARSLGDLYATMAQANDKRRQDIATFNYTVDKANADNILQAAAENAENILQAQKERGEMYQAAQNLRYNERTGTDEAHGNNIAALIQRQYDKDQNVLQWAALNAYMPVTGGYDLNQYLVPLWERNSKQTATQQTTATT